MIVPERGAAEPKEAHFHGGNTLLSAKKTHVFENHLMILIRCLGPTQSQSEVRVSSPSSLIHHT